ncbi:hypothetical protein G7Y79_00053g088330 [Physcia stellaris]|nr:hypothetical protein G7Y79_00053g088330 [Physcia stellaris]
MADTQFETLIRRFANSESGRLRHYIYILGAYWKDKFPPRKTCEQKHSDQPARDGPNDLSAEALRHGLEKLPKELQQATEAMLIESTLYPDFIFPDQAPGPNGRHFFLGNYYEPPKYEILLALNRENYAWHGPQFWDNFFVVGRGGEGRSLRWLQRMDKDARRKIRKVYLSLDARDLTGEELTSDAERRSWICYQRGAIFDPISMMEEFDQECNRVAERLCAIWYFKLEILASLKLESLVVDVRDAVGLDGSCLAGPFMGSAPSFGRNRPNSVEILAEDDELAAEILEGFR